MEWLTHVLWFPVFSVFGVPTPLVEIVGFVTGARCVWLPGRLGSWPATMASATSAC